jgi:hypothetical protein
VVLAVNGYNETRDLVLKFVKEKDLKQRILLQGGSVARDKYAVTGYPTSFLINPAGEIVDREVGFGPGMAGATERKLKKLLEKDSRPAGGD